MENSGITQIGAVTSKAAAIRDYVEAAAQFEKASLAFNAACQEVRRLMPTKDRFLVWANGSNYLVEIDDVGNFKVEPVKQL